MKDAHRERESSLVSVDVHGPREGAVPRRWTYAAGAALVLLAGGTLLVMLWLAAPGAFDEGLLSNLIAEAIGVTVFAGIVAVVLKVRDDRQWRPAETLMASRLGHWVARVFMNAGLVLPPEGGRRPVRFIDKVNRIGYSFPPDADFDELGRKVADTFRRYAIADDLDTEEIPNVAESANKYYRETELDLGQGVWQWLQEKLQIDLDHIAEVTGRYELLLLTRHRKLFGLLSELEDMRGLISGPGDVAHVTSGIYAAITGTTKEIADELKNIGHPCRLRGHAVRAGRG